VFDAAYAYHARFKPQALVLSRADAIVFERYDGGFAAAAPHALYSGTKSFWGVAAIEAQHDGLLRLDEPVSATFESWKNDAWKASVTLRMLLQLVAGVPFGGLGASVPPYAKALDVQLRAEPGTAFTYGGIPLQIFGAVFSAKLQGRGSTPHEYLRQRVLDPAGVAIARWRTMADGSHPLPTGAFTTARDWLAYGRFVCERRARYAECFGASQANPRYGLCWWLQLPGTPADLFYASGSGGQALYVIPSLGLIAARFGAGGSFNHAAFVKRLVQDAKDA